MTALKTRTICVVAAASLILAVQTASLGASSDPYSQVVVHIQKNYLGKKVNIPFLGLANFMFKFWHPAGVKNVKLTFFEEHSLYPKEGSKDFDAVVNQAAGGAWTRLVKVYSRKNNDWIYIYYTDPNKDVK